MADLLRSSASAGLGAERVHPTALAQGGALHLPRKTDPAPSKTLRVLPEFGVQFLRNDSVVSPATRLQFYVLEAIPVYRKCVTELADSLRRVCEYFVRPLRPTPTVQTLNSRGEPRCGRKVDYPPLTPTRRQRYSALAPQKLTHARNLSDFLTAAAGARALLDGWGRRPSLSNGGQPVGYCLAHWLLPHQEEQ